MARLISIPHFLSESSVEEAKEDNSLLRKAKKQNDEVSVQRLNLLAVRRIHQQFCGYLIRRSTDSVNWKGEKLLNLPPYKDIVGILSLTDRETVILDQRAKDAKAK